MVLNPKGAGTWSDGIRPNTVFPQTPDLFQPQVSRRFVRTLRYVHLMLLDIGTTSGFVLCWKRKINERPIKSTVMAARKKRVSSSSGGPRGLQSEMK